MKKERTSGEGKGLISSGGDKAGYLGHFRNADVLKRGHNQGAPGGDLTPPTGPPPNTPPLGVGGPIDSSHPMFNPISNPTGFAKATKPRPTYDPKLNPVLGTRQALKASGKAGTPEGRVEMRAARKASTMIPAAQRHATAKAARAAVAPGPANAAEPTTPFRTDVIRGARAGLATAVGGVREARQGLRSAIRGGDVKGAATAFSGLTAARGARKTARQSVRTAQRGT